MENNGLSVVTVDSVKLKMAITLSKVSLGVQKLQNEADNLILNRDNIQSIKEFLEKGKKAEKITEETHKVNKKPFYDSGKACDDAKNETIALIKNVTGPVQIKFDALCAELDREIQIAAAAKSKKEEIERAVDSNILYFSNKIASCQTKKDLQDVERLINLEKSPSRASKYDIHHEYAINRYNEVILPILKDQKENIEQKEELEKQIAEAEKISDIDKMDELMFKKEQVEDSIIENQVKIQEQALNQAAPQGAFVEEVLPNLKTKRMDIISEIVDIEAAFKKNRELLSIELKTIDAKKTGRMLYDAGAFGNNEELVVNGIKYSLKKQW